MITNLYCISYTADLAHHRITFPLLNITEGNTLKFLLLLGLKRTSELFPVEITS